MWSDRATERDTAIIRVSGGVEIFSAGSHLVFIIIRYEHHHHHKFKPHTSGQVWELIRNCVAIIYMLIARLAKLATLIYQESQESVVGSPRGSVARRGAARETRLVLVHLKALLTYVRMCFNVNELCGSYIYWGEVNKWVTFRCERAAFLCTRHLSHLSFALCWLLCLSAPPFAEYSSSSCVAGKLCINHLDQMNN